MAAGKKRKFQDSDSKVSKAGDDNFKWEQSNNLVCRALSYSTEFFLKTFFKQRNPLLETNIAECKKTFQTKVRR